MTDIRNLYKLVVELEQNREEDDAIQLHDSFDIELHESFVIETGVVGFTDDGIIVEADETTLEFLEINDILIESEDNEVNVITENPALMALGRTAAMGFGTQMGDRVADKIGLEEKDELDEIKRLGGLTEDDSSDAVYNAIVRRMMMQHTDVLGKFGPSAVMAAIEDLASNMHDLEEIGSSDVSIWTKEVIRDLEAGHYDHLKEESKPGLWANIHAKRKRIKAGSGERMRKPGSKGAPSAQDFKDAAKEDVEMSEAEYQGRKVPLGKPMQGDVKKSKVYVRKPNGKVVKVNFGDKNMKIKKSNPDRRKSFRARHNCDNPGPRWKARYWSCRAW